MLMLMLFKTKATVYYVTPDNHHSVDRNIQSLQYYLMNSTNYFISHNQLNFLSGEHFLQSDFTLQNVKNFTITGNNSIITCKNIPVGMTFINVNNITLKDIKIIQCGKHHKVLFNASSDEYEDIRPIWNSTIYINNCSVTINNLSINVKAGMSGIIAVNIYMMRSKDSTMTDVCVYADCHSSLPVNGILFYYFDYANYTSKEFQKIKHKISIFNYAYGTNGSCHNSFALKVIMMQLNYPAETIIRKTHFINLQNSSILHYFGKSCGENFNTVVRFNECSIKYNKGTYINLFHIIIHSEGDLFGSIKGRKFCNQQTNIISLHYCLITKNSNIRSLLYAALKNTLAFNLYIDFKFTNFTFNHGVQFIRTRSELKALWQSSHYITMNKIVIASNTVSYKASLISSTNGVLKFSQDIIIKNNTCGNIIRLRLSVLKFKGYNEFTFNQARHILRSKEGSYYLLKGITTVNISHNFVYSVLDVDPAYDDNLNKVCYFQFISNGNEKADNKTIVNYKIIMTTNTYTAPEHYLINVSSMDCIWLKGTVFSTVESRRVLSEIVETKRITASKQNIGTINSSVCLCTNSHSINCSEHKLGSIFPGQTLKVQLTINLLKAHKDNSTTMIAKTKELPLHACTIVNVAEIVQEHSSSGCNQYNYTIWSDRPECELYLGTENTPEIFYVDLKVCPVGFSLQHSKKGCYCDPNLNTGSFFILSCSLDDATILRPGNSWISADITNNSYTYYVSSQCPFDYCLSHSSHHNLSNPDAQCQFHRSGVLCGRCQQGLSTVFGSSQCKQCTNYYLLIIIPIAVAGFILVLLIFIFNLTITDGTINIFIFYANIISINFSLFCTKRYYIDGCTLLSLINLDMGFEICFYNGMDGYAKMWLQLAFPFYLVSIAVALIIGSRYFATIQRLTAHRALQVLATLILLSYTKVLLTVCQVLFFFSPIIHLPSKHTKLVWSVDPSVLITTKELLALYTICAILFVIMLLFNILLLFPRTLSRFKLVNKFKPLLDAFLGPYKDNFSFWTGLQLLLRGIFFSTSALDHEVSLTCGIVVLGAVLCIQGVIHPFKSRFKNIQESLILFNLLTLYSILTIKHDSNKTAIYIMKSLINIVLLYFIIFIAHRCVMVTCGNGIIQKCKTMINSLKKAKVHTLPVPRINIQIPDVTYNYQEFQEPLIELES